MEVREPIAAIGEIRAGPLMGRAEQYALETAAHLATLEQVLLSGHGARCEGFQPEIALDPILEPEERERCRDAVQTILHCRFLVCGHLFRALSGRVAREEGCPDFDAEEDARRSARRAWEGIQRSIEAWLTLWKDFPEREAGILEMLLQLDRLRRDVEMEFPGSPAAE